MRILDIIEEKRQNWRTDLRRTILRLRNKYGSDEQLHHGHSYRVTLTGELITINSVGPQVAITRHDADSQKEYSIPKDDAQFALDTGIIKHDRKYCQKCPNPRRR